MREKIKNLYHIVDNKTDCNHAGAKQFEMGYSTFQRTMLKPKYLKDIQLKAVHNFLIEWVKHEIETKNKKLTSFL